MANDRLSLMSPSLYRVTYISHGSLHLKNRRVSSELSHSRQGLGLSCNDIFLKSCKNESPNHGMYLIQGWERVLKKGFFFDICMYSGMKQRIQAMEELVTCQCA